MPKAASGPDSFPDLITVHGCPNNTPLFWRQLERVCLLQLKEPEWNKGKPGHKDQGEDHANQCQFSLALASRPETDPSKIASGAWSIFYFSPCALLSHLSLMTTLQDNNVRHTFIRQISVQLLQHVSPALSQKGQRIMALALEEDASLWTEVSAFYKWGERPRWGHGCIQAPPAGQSRG